MVHTYEKSSIKSHSIRVLLLAYTCSPYRGSEPGVGWHRAIESAKYFDTWVICEMHEFKDDIERYFIEHGKIQNLHFCFVPRIVSDKSLESVFYKVRFLYYFLYNLWHRRAYRVAIKLHNELHFNIVHQVCLNGFREPGYLWKLDVPFVWGPVGGTQNYPWRFLKNSGINVLLREGLRGIINTFQFRFSYRVRKAARQAAALLAANTQVMRDFEMRHSVKPILLLETGIDFIVGKSNRKADRDRPLRILWSGAFEYNKALDLLIKALGKKPMLLRYELRILGKGPSAKYWKRLAKREGVEPHCKWLGWLSQDEAISQFKWADVFVFTSLRDTSGNVVLESLSQGIAVVCLDHQGVGDIVTTNCGIKISVTTKDEVVNNLHDTLVYLSENRDILKKLSQGGVERAREYLWMQNGKKMVEIYKDIILSQRAKYEDVK